MSTPKSKLMFLLALVGTVLSFPILAGNRLSVAFGEGRFHTNTLAEDLAQDMGGSAQKYSRAAVVLIETPDLENKMLLEQEKIIKKMGTDVEELMLLEVVACPTEEDQDGYHLTVDDSKLLMGSTSKFKVLILNRYGNVIEKADAPLAAENIRKTLQSHANAGAN